MTEPTFTADKGIFAYDLGASSESMWAAMAKPRPCPVCGKGRPGMALTPLRDLGRPRSNPHADCDRQITAWDQQASTVNQDPDYLAAVEAAEEAQGEADRVWEGKVRALGLPEWVVTRQIALRAAARDDR